MKRRRPTTTIPQTGEYCLIGRAGISMPADWILCSVVFADAEGVLVGQWAGGDTWRTWYGHDEVRFCGSISAVNDFRVKCAAEVEPMKDAVKAAEAALEAARKAVWAKLDEIGARR